METKVYKNENMIRTKHNVIRFVFCNNMEEMNRFMALYEDKFDSCNTFDSSTYGCCGVVGRIKKSEFDEIAKALGLVKVRWSRQNRHWKMEGASV